MTIKEWIKPPRPLLAFALGITLILAAALVWLALRFLHLDRELQAQRVREHLNRTADVVAVELAESVATAETLLRESLHLSQGEAIELLADASDQLAEDGLFLVFSQAGCLSRPEGRLLFLPYSRQVRELPDHRFFEAEKTEFQQRDYSRAAALFSQYTDSEDPAIKAAARLGWGRNLAKGGQVQAALAAYADLIACGSTPVEGVPAEVAGCYARCLIFITELSVIDRILRHLKWRPGRALEPGSRSPPELLAVAESA